MASQILLPGDSVTVPLADGKAIALGPGITYVPPEPVLVPTHAGPLGVMETAKSKIVYIDSTPKVYTPTAQDPVIGVIVARQNETFLVSLGPYMASPSVVTLPFTSVSALAAASKKNRPNLKIGSVVYGRIVGAGPNGSGAVDRDLRPELTCIDATATGVTSGGYGELKGGCVFEVGVGLCRRLLQASSAKAAGVPNALDYVGKYVSFEIAIGRNGQIWIDSDSVQATRAVWRAIVETEHMDEAQMEKHVVSILKDLR
ncbi:uncharacterized protein V1510DRAFT_415182 [Dipodascopsis tothii]|uniref:uncharacterized protein n=1 Tax=Dipodascopsis tothii TaxID=44089 RepID=UPI0034CDCA6E